MELFLHHVQMQLPAASSRMSSGLAHNLLILIQLDVVEFLHLIYQIVLR